MASIIRVKRSTGTSAPATLNYGELAYTIGGGTQANNGQRFFIGDNSSNPQLIGGQYYTDLLSNTPGSVASAANATTASNGFVAIVDENRKVDQWNVDNLRLDGNAFTSTDTDGHITITPNGTGRVQFLDDDELQFGSSDDIRLSYDTAKDAIFFERGGAGTTADIRVADDIHFQFGTDNDARIYYDETSTDRIQVEGASWSFDSTVAQVRIETTTHSSDSTTGALVVDGGVGIAGTVNIGSDVNISGDTDISQNLTIQQNLTVYGDTNLGNSISDTITIAGIVTHVGTLINVGGATFDGVGISSNTISTKIGSGNVLYIDPYPDGLSNEGLVVVKGDLQVDGTTTTVNSTTVSANEAIFNLGDVTSVRSVTVTVGSGSSEITLDSIVGINTGDVISGSSALPGAGTTTIHSYDTGTKVVRIDGVTTGSIGISTQLTLTHAYDTNTDRGISFNYNTSSGTDNNKTGFFGFDDNSIATSGVYESHADDSRRWTYVPDANVSNSVVSGTKGFLDIKGIYYQSGDFSTHGVVYFDSTGLQRSTSAPASATFTSTQIMTAVTEIVLTLDSTHSFVAGQQITQANNSSAYGMVKSSTSSVDTVTLIGVQGTFDITNDLLKEGSNISIVPTDVSTTYTNRPIWTTTIDGGTF